MPERRLAAVRRMVDRQGNQLVAVLLGLGTVLLMIAVTAATVTMGSITNETDLVEQTLSRQSSLYRMTTYNEQIENGRRGFLIQPEPVFVATIRSATQAFEAELEQARSLFSSDYEGTDAIERIATLQAQRNAIVDETLADPQGMAARDIAADLRLDRARERPGVAPQPGRGVGAADNPFPGNPFPDDGASDPTASSATGNPGPEGLPDGDSDGDTMGFDSARPAPSPAAQPGRPGRPRSPSSAQASPPPSGSPACASRSGRRAATGPSRA